MPTDDERREVARRLRELDDSDLQVYDMTYFAMQRAVGGEGEPYLDGRELTDRLADLIEPSCDSDALLALADEMDERAPYGWYGGERDSLRDYARRIRDALGVADG